MKPVSCLVLSVVKTQTSFEGKTERASAKRPETSPAIFLFSCGKHLRVLKTKQCCMFGGAPAGLISGLFCRWDGTFYNAAVGPLSLIHQSKGDIMTSLTSPAATPQSMQLFIRSAYARQKCVQTFAARCFR